MKTIKLLAAPVVAASVILLAWTQLGARSEGTVISDSAYPNARALRLDGVAQKVGNGTTRAYVVVDQESGAALEIGVALSEGLMDGLPAPMKMEGPMTMEHLDMHMWNLALPQQNPTPYKFVQFGWNPQGHEPAGVWDTPHFDFHFYTVPQTVVSSIAPSDPQFADKAAKFPAQSLRAPFYIDAATAAKAPAAALTIPQMGLHWIDVRTPEIQAMAGHPEAYKPFTRTFIYGSWNGDFIFGEPMITRAYLLEKKATTDAAVRDEIIPVPAAGFPAQGSYASAYRIKWDAETREYRIALTGFGTAK